MPTSQRTLLVLLLAASCCGKFGESNYKYHADGSLIWPHGVVNHLSDTNEHYLVCKFLEPECRSEYR